LIFLAVSKSRKLLEWSESIGNSSGVVKTGYVIQPHLSLYYSPEGIETPAADKVSMLNDVLKMHPEWFSKNIGKGEFDKGCEVEFDSIEVRIEYDENKIDTWKKICEFILNKEK
jgi:hypothetical protein